MSKPSQCGRFNNRLLDSLPQSEGQNIASELQAVRHELSDLLYELRGPIEYVYFPTTCVASALAIMTDGSAIEVATIGNEGVVGHTAANPSRTSSNRVVVQIAGDSLRMTAHRLEATAGQSPAFQNLLGRYSTAYLYQISQAVACNGLHQLEKRCCRWLLMTRDRIASTEIPLTHEYLSMMLGVRRSSVSEVLAQLQAEGLLNSRRGKIVLVDPAGVESRSCECYRLVKDEYDRLLGPK